ncbi:Di-sulfide bridge nucleocytoplasmic transport domain-containing protein [Cyathus striatus]|nr:Di-sulfide bridge nucleocytoplasmic transport domain-containing protein [Cyathus striatus]
MAGRFQTYRSKEAPMDYQWTNRNEVKPVWVAGDTDMETPRKRPHDSMNSPARAFDTPQPPIFGANQNVPFMFQQSIPQNPQTWTPPSQFSPTKAFPPQEELKDVDMTEASPEKREEKESEDGNGRPMSFGGLRRIYNSRRRRGFKSRRGEDEADDIAALTQNTSNHYTLNLPAPAPLPSDTPYVLLGYLQFFFNLSLILLFLYLVMQFILTVQRDVEHRIAEYSQDIVQEIAMCALQYKNNQCATNAIPAMTQQCANWEACMNRDPSVIGRARVGAELIAEVVNGFVEPISWKTLIFTLTSLAFLTVFINALLSLYRSRHQPALHHLLLSPLLIILRSISGTIFLQDLNMESPARRRRLDGGENANTKLR